RGRARVSVAPVARLGSSGGRVVTEAISRQISDKKRSNRSKGIREAGRGREASAQGSGAVRQTAPLPCGGVIHEFKFSSVGRRCGRDFQRRVLAGDDEARTSPWRTSIPMSYIAKFLPRELRKT